MFSEKFPVVILANGEFPSHYYPLKILQDASEIICCDGATNELVNHGFIPTAIVGDGDSIDKSLKQQFSDRIFIDNSVEYNDLQKSFHFILKNDIPKIAILGASGKRDDHFLANISIMMMYAEKYNLDIVLISDYGIFTPVFSTTTLKSYPKQQVSIFSFSPDVPVTLIDLRYPLQEKKLQYFWEGSLNEALKEEFTVQIQSGKFLIYREF